MLKLAKLDLSALSRGAAAFGRLCVETVAFFDLRFNCCAAAFGRLCVETAAFW